MAATKLQNLETVESYGKTVDAKIAIDREQGTGQWTVTLAWTLSGFEAKCYGRAKTLEAALQDAVTKAEFGGLA